MCFKKIGQSELCHYFVAWKWNDFDVTIIHFHLNDLPYIFLNAFEFLKLKDSHITQIKQKNIGRTWFSCTVWMLYVTKHCNINNENSKQHMDCNSLMSIQYNSSFNLITECLKQGEFVHLIV